MRTTNAEKSLALLSGCKPSQNGPVTSWSTPRQDSLLCSQQIRQGIHRLGFMLEVKQRFPLCITSLAAEVNFCLSPSHIHVLLVKNSITCKSCSIFLKYATYIGIHTVFLVMQNGTMSYIFQVYAKYGVWRTFFYLIVVIIISAIDQKISILMKAPIDGKFEWDD